MTAQQHLSSILSEDVRFRIVLGEAVVLQQQTNEIFIMNETGSRVIALIADGLTFDQITDAIAAEYEADRDQIASDLTGYLKALKEENILVRN